jgi:hypothetical protein
LFTLASLALAVPVALAQRWLFRLASPGAGLDFSQRATDELGAAFVPSLFVSFVLVCPLLAHFQQPGHGAEPLAPTDPLDGGMRVQFAVMAALTALLAVAINLAAFNIYVRVGDDAIVHSDLQSLGSQTHLASEIREIVIHAQRRLPSGVISDEPFLEVQFADGMRLESHRLMFREEYFEPLIAALQKNAPAPIPVRRERGPS